ncbi:MAG TPA: MltA domain-containing protein, partial [Desulfobacteraceae bacterium]|nr:MltA domain-containing protein [Desulfobacteraceae bacterium]
MMTKKFPRQNSATPMLLILWVLLACLTGCAPEKETPVQPPPALKKLAKPLYPEFSDTGKKKELVAALENSLTYFSRIPSQRKFHFSGDVYTAGHVRQSLTTFLEFIQTGPGNDELNRFIKTNYAVYQAAGSNDRGEVLFTGYYEPSIAGSLTRDEQYRFPLYSEPEDLLTLDPGLFFDNLQGKALRMARVDKNNRVVPYFSRKE